MSGEEREWDWGGGGIGEGDWGEGRTGGGRGGGPGGGEEDRGEGRGGGLRGWGGRRGTRGRGWGGGRGSERNLLGRCLVLFWFQTVGHSCYHTETGVGSDEKLCFVVTRLQMKVADASFLPNSLLLYEQLTPTTADCTDGINITTMQQRWPLTSRDGTGEALT